MTGFQDSTLSIDQRLAQARQLLGSNPAQAMAQAEVVLSQIPDHPMGLLIRGVSLRILGQTSEALSVLEPLALGQSHAGPVWLELGIARGEAGQAKSALIALKTAAQLMPQSPDVWRYLADQLESAGESAAAEAARSRYLLAASRDPALIAAANALVDNNLPVADSRLLQHLAMHPKDVAALRMRAEIAARLRRYTDAQQLLEECLALAPSFDAARYNYAVVLNRQGKAATALQEVTRLLASEPRNPGYQNLKAAVLAHLGDFAESIEVYESVLRDYNGQPKVWMSYGHALKTAGRVEESINAYRESIRQEPSLGEAYWSLANLKTFRFTDADVEAMQGQLSVKDLDADDRLHFEFALGKAREDSKAYAQAFGHYQSGNELRRATYPYSAAEHSAYIDRTIALFTPEFLAARANQGVSNADSIFIVGLPRAGSTLIEQILASHSQVEGTMELPHLPQLAMELVSQAEKAQPAQSFEHLLSALIQSQWADLGERYLQSTKAHRKTAAPYFIDKMPNNCLYLGLISVMLPRAKIIDARRHPLGCCFSAYKQHFARGQNFTYDLADVGWYYRDYVRLMAHFDALLPGRVHRVFYEQLVDDTDSQVRSLLAYCGLPFEEGCLRFYDNDRAVRTASSEQVRQPIFRSGLEQWQHFDPWLAPLKEALGSVLESYPLIPHTF